MNLLKTLLGGRRSGENAAGTNTNPRNKKAGPTSAAWLAGVPADAQIMISAGANHIQSVVASDLQSDPRVVEDVLLEDLGPRHYTLTPTVGNRRMPAFTARVGDPAAQQLNLRPREVDRIGELEAEIKRLNANDSGVGVLGAVLGNLDKVVSAIRGPGDVAGNSNEILDAMRLAFDMRGEGMGISDFASLVQTVREMTPAPTPAPTPAASTSDPGWEQYLAPIIGKIMGVEPPTSATLAGAGTESAAKPGADRVGFADASDPVDTHAPLVLAMLRSVQQAAVANNPDAVATIILKSLNVAHELDLDADPIVVRFYADPGAAFDEFIAANVPEVTGGLATAARAQVVDAVQIGLAELKQDDGPTAEE